MLLKIEFFFLKLLVVTFNFENTSVHKGSAGHFTGLPLRVKSSHANGFTHYY